MVELKNLSLMEVAEQILKKNKQPMTFMELFKSLSEAKELTDEERARIISQFYADFIASARFIYMGDDMWDLKSRQSIDMWDKDGAFYQEYPESEDETTEDSEEEEEEAPEEEEEESIDRDLDEEEEDVVDDDTIVYENEDEVDEEKNVVEKHDEFDDDKYNEYMDDYEDMYDE
ncbi:MAG: DNA-directed RNA polymerase subunit delta [Candidatus Izemoplasmatales bacterium]|jgi:DNA-directed RNA polymerase delta subunit